MTKDKLLKANEIDRMLCDCENHLQDIEESVKRGGKVEFRLPAGCRGELYMQDLLPIDSFGFYNQYHSNLVAKIAKLKKQFAAL